MGPRGASVGPADLAAGAHEVRHAGPPDGGSDAGARKVPAARSTRARKWRTGMRGVGGRAEHANAAAARGT
jgi:hypothetical protein